MAQLGCDLLARGFHAPPPVGSQTAAAQDFWGPTCPGSHPHRRGGAGVALTTRGRPGWGGGREEKAPPPASGHPTHSRRSELGGAAWAQMFASCVTLDELFCSSESHFPCLSCGK